MPCFVPLMRRTRRGSGHALAAGVMVGVAMMTFGCAPSQGPSGRVAGRVTLADKAVEGGDVIFFKEVGVPVGGAALRAGGEFHLDKPLPVGEYRVTIQPPPEAPPTPDGPPPAASPAAQIPPQYMSEATSGLTASVKEGENTFSFELK